jgi:UDP-N-acetylglucosamine 1-carboxyvinyltransferase
MEFYEIRGGNRLFGECEAGVAKNAALPILAAALMADEYIEIQVPMMSDIKYMAEILGIIGCGVEIADGLCRIDPTTANCHVMPERLSKLIRSSIFMMGPMLAKFSQAEFTYPGGCEIGLRPIDLHLRGLRELGAKITEDNGRIHCSGALKGAVVHFDYPSVGATENIMMAATLAQGETVIENAAMEPEIVDLANFLSMMGAKTTGAGTRRIRIRGVKKLHGGHYRPMTDRIIVGTLLAAAAATGGDIRVTDAEPGDLQAVLAKLQQMGCILDSRGKGIGIISPLRLKAFRTLETMPYPGFPTDMQTQFLAIQSMAEGAGAITENIFENRFATASELVKMGADIVVKDRTAFVRGVEKLHGADVEAKDLRGGVALVIAGLAAQGLTTVRDIHYIDRGYDRFEDTLKSLGADIKRLECDAWDCAHVY